MRSKTCSGSLAVALILLSIPASAEVQPQGRELRVNRRTDFKQLNPASAFSPAGGAVVAWENDQRGIRGLFYAASGWPTGAELTLVESSIIPALPFSGPVVNRRDPAVAFLNNGQLLLAWTEERAFLSVDHFIEHRNIEDQDIFVQRFSAGGAPLGDRIRVNATTLGFQHGPKLVARNGGFLVVWEDGGIVGRVLDSSGQPVGAEISISEGSGRRPDLAANAQGKVLVVWDGEDANELGVFARLLDAGANPVGSELRVNTDTAFRQARPAVAADKAGNFFVVWQGEHREFWRGFFYLYGQAIGAGGNLVGPQVRLYRGSLANGAPQVNPALAAIPSGHFLLTWLTWKSRSSIDMAGVELDGLGAPVGEAFWITERKVRSTFSDISVAANGAGKFLVAWETSDREAGISARRLNAP